MSGWKRLQKTMAVGLTFLMLLSAGRNLLTVNAAKEGTAAVVGSTEYETLQEAVDAAIRDGSDEPVVLQRDVTETIAIDGTVTLDLNQHAVDGNRQGTVVSVTGGDVAIQNGTITGGSTAENGGGISAAGGTLSLDTVTVTGNEARGDTSISTGNGGGIYILGATAVQIDHCVIQDNIAQKKGAGLCVRETSSEKYLTSFTVTDTVIQGNTVDGGNGSGGGAYLSVRAGASLERVQVTGNACTRTSENTVTSGGGIYLFTTDSGNSYQLHDVTFEENIARNGAELYLYADAEIEDCVFTGSDYSGETYSVKSAVAVDQNCTGSQHDFRNCTVSNYRGLGMTPMDLESRANLIDCLIEDNEAAECGGVYCYAYNSGVYLDNTVVRGNKATGGEDALSGGLYVVYCELDRCDGSLNFGAVYGNTTNGENLAHDICIADYGTVHLRPANEMRDSRLEEKSFEDYIWKDLVSGSSYPDETKITVISSMFDPHPPVGLTAVEEIIRDVARVGDTVYQDLASAVENAAGDTVVLIAGEDGDSHGPTINLAAPIAVSGPVQIDMNGKNIGPANAAVFQVSGSGVLSLSGVGGQVMGALEVSGDGSVRVSDSVQVDRIVHNGSEVFLNTDACRELDLTLGEGKFVTYGEAFDAESITIHLADAVLREVNEGSRTEDVLLLQADPARSLAREDAGKLLDRITIPGWTNRLYLLALNDNGGIVLRRDTAPAVYVDGGRGSDEKDGLSDAAPVRTFERAKEVAAKENISRIYVMGTLTAEGTAEWSLPENTILQRYPAYEGYLAEVKSGGSLTLRDIVIDGSSERGVVADDSLFLVSGELILDHGSVLQNNNMVQENTGSYHLGGAVSVNSSGTLHMLDGSAVRDNAAQLGGGVYVRGGTFVMDGGVVENNQAQLPGSTRESAGGGVMLYTGDTKAATMVMNGGVIRNNTSDQFGGGISLGNIWGVSVESAGCRLVMTGGSIQNNTAQTCGGGIFVQMNCTAAIEASAGNTVLIQENQALDGLFSGGGIYVNGGKSGNTGITEPEKYEDGILYLKNAVITDNTAENGGGIAGCATSTSEIYLEQGGVVYGNHVTDGSAGDLLISNLGLNGTPSADAPKAYLSEFMLGGGENKWMSADGALVPVSELHSDGGKSLTNGVSASDDDVKRAGNLASVQITRNAAGEYGGGIGSNGRIVIGEATVQIRPADVIIYMGGLDGNDTAVNGDNQIVHDTNTLPVPGFVVDVPLAVRDAMLDMENPDDFYLKYQSGDASLSWKLEKYGDGEHNIYRIVPRAETGAVNIYMKFTDSDGSTVTTDQFQVSELKRLNQFITMEVYGENIDAGLVTAVCGGKEYAISTGTAEIDVRNATKNAQYGFVKNGEPADKVPGISAPQGTIYTINHTPVQVDDPEAVGLLFDNIVENNDYNYNNSALLKYRTNGVLDALGEDCVLPDGERQYELKYLDLIDRNNGDVWLTADQPLTIYWPLPEGTTRDTRFELLHFCGLHRDMEVGIVGDDILDENLVIERLTDGITVTDTHVEFVVQPMQEDGSGNVTGGFSPFALVWSEPGKSDPGAPDGPDSPDPGAPLPTDPGEPSEPFPGDPENPTPEDPGESTPADPENPAPADPDEPGSGSAESPDSADPGEAGSGAPDTYREPDIPKTGDTRMTGLWALLCAGSLIGLSLTLRKKNHCRARRMRR